MDTGLTAKIMRFLAEDIRGGGGEACEGLELLLPMFITWEAMANGKDRDVVALRRSYSWMTTHIDGNKQGSGQTNLFDAETS